MMTPISRKKLAPLFGFFESYGAERLQGLDESYFSALNDEEKEEAWNFLKDGFDLSPERITGLYILNKSRAVDLFKQALRSPFASSVFAAERQALEGNRLLMLKYVNSVEPDKNHINAMSQFARSEFARVRTQFAQSLPADQSTSAALDALKGMIFTEAERIPLTSAITKFMAIHGMDYDMDNPLYKSIYLSLRSDSQKEKISGMRRLELNASQDPIK